MPDPLLYLKAMGASAIVSAMFALMMASMRRPAGATWLNLSCVFGIGIGLAVGNSMLGLRLGWPPVNGLDRLMMIVVPAALGIELIAGLRSVPRWIAWFLRASLAASIPRILLHGSVYLNGTDGDWALWQIEAAMVVSSLLLAGCWGLLDVLLQSSGGISIPLALCLTTQCAGLTVMMAGYIKGGAAAFPLAATIVATAIPIRFTSKRSGTSAGFDSSAIAGIGFVSLFGLLFIGRFFGRLSTVSALVLLSAPLLCWVTELPLLRNRKPLLVGSLRLIAVAIPLLVVLTLAKYHFDRAMAPLLGLTFH